MSAIKDIEFTNASKHNRRVLTSNEQFFNIIDRVERFTIERKEENSYGQKSCPKNIKTMA